MKHHPLVKFDDRFYTFDAVNGHRKMAHPDMWKKQKEKLAKFLEEMKKQENRSENDGKF